MAGLIEVEYVTSRRGTQQVLFQGHLHNKNSTKEHCIHWKWVVKTCRGSITTVGNYVRSTTLYNHGPYILTTWVDDDARFPIPLWNHHRNIGPRTNNNLEGFHYRLNKSLPHHHPNIYRFVELIKQIEKSESAKMRQIDFGAAPQGRKRVYREKENRLIRLWDQLQAVREPADQELPPLHRIATFDCSTFVIAMSQLRRLQDASLV
ncbi:uncharacterized protein [Haliotis cracherodii]|uniref:uncharacterized protein n=1 Tax=Haliotis cracherodii TaxID=6455 RepID=UPI0039E9D753